MIIAFAVVMLTQICLSASNEQRGGPCRHTSVVSLNLSWLKNLLVYTNRKLCDAETRFIVLFNLAVGLLSLYKVLQSQKLQCKPAPVFTVVHVHEILRLYSST